MLVTLSFYLVSLFVGKIDIVELKFKSKYKYLLTLKAAHTSSF